MFDISSQAELLSKLRGNSSSLESYASRIGSYLGAHNVFLFQKGRVALYTIFKSIGLSTGDEVILQGYTCVVVANAIKYCGAVPVYVDIDTDTYCASFESVKAKVTTKTKVIICQNTYGLSHEVDEIALFGKERGLITIEDCTHGFGGYYKGRSNGAYCDFAFYSTQWNKPYSTGLGGILVVNNEQHLRKTEHQTLDLLKPGFIESFQLYLMVVFKASFVSERGYNYFRSLYRMLSRLGVVTGSSSNQELDSVDIPAGYFKGFPAILCGRGSSALDKLSAQIETRKKIGRWYSELLLASGKNHVPVRLHANHSFLTYPLLVKDREKFREEAARHGVPLGDWFISPLHPVEEEFKKWDLCVTDVPVAVHCSDHMINLPTSVQSTDSVEKLILASLDNILDVRSSGRAV